MKGAMMTINNPAPMQNVVLTQTAFVMCDVNPGTPRKTPTTGPAPWFLTQRGSFPPGR